MASDGLTAFGWLRSITLRIPERSGSYAQNGVLPLLIRLAAAMVLSVPRLPSPDFATFGRPGRGHPGRRPRLLLRNIQICGVLVWVDEFGEGVGATQDQVEVQA
jgi:hypothetical protein